MSIISRVINRLTPRRLAAALTPEGVEEWLDNRYHGHRDPWLGGRRREAAETVWKPNRFPTVYATIPSDVRRPVVWDGKLLGGYATTWLAERHLKPEVLANAGKAALTIGIKAGLLTTTIVGGAACAMTAYTLFETNALTALFGPYPAWSEGISWMPRLAWLAMAGTEIVSRTATNLAFAVGAGALLTPALVFWAFWNKLQTFWQRASAAFRIPTRDAILYKNREDVRHTEYLAYARQAARAITLAEAGLPLIPIGKATGVFRARGDMEAPVEGQIIGVDADALRQHLLIFGETGGGKTRLLIRPLFNRILTADWGMGHRMGAYVTDGKGTLWKDLLASEALQKRIDEAKDVRVVGTGEGHYGVNLLKGRTPIQVANLFLAVVEQLVGGSKDPTWRQQASLLLQHCATIAQVLELDPDLYGVSWKNTWSTCRPWSVMGVALLATSDQARDLALARIRELGGIAENTAHPDHAAMADDLKKLVLDDDASNSETWLRGSFGTLNPATKTSIQSSVNEAFGSIGNAGALRDRFCTGLWGRKPGEQTTGLAHALEGGIILNAIGETEWGVPGKMACIWMKTCLYLEAKERLNNLREECKHTSCAVVMDECQMLMTSGADSDQTTWNWARESGMFLVAATQSMAALRGALGEATDNVVNLLLTKICLKTQEASTMDFFIKLAGCTRRGTISEDNLYETYAMREHAHPDQYPGAAFSDNFELSAVMATTPDLPQQAMSDIIELDRRFILRQSSHKEGPANDITQSWQSATWRREDKEDQVKVAGYGDQPLITTREMLFGSALAFAIVQRAGKNRMDIIDLDLGDA